MSCYWHLSESWVPLDFRIYNDVFVDSKIADTISIGLHYFICEMKLKFNKCEDEQNVIW